MNMKRHIPGPGKGWKRLAGAPVYERTDGLRVHMLGIAKLTSGDYVFQSSRMHELIRMNGNRRRGVLAWAAELESDLGNYRGHQMVLVGGAWVYLDTSEPVLSDPNRACGYCGLKNTTEGHDGCIGELPGVMNACCGHGVESGAYVQFLDGSCLRGTDASEHLLIHRPQKNYQL